MKISRILPAALVLAVAAPMLTACSDDTKTTWEEYADWREENQAWINKQLALTDAQGKPLFTTFTPSYAPANTIHYRFVNDPAENAGNLQPYYTSTVTVNYTVRLCNGTKIDSAANYTSTLNDSGLIPGWALAIQQMHCGDSIEAILPYNVAYGTTGSGSVPPYSALRFNLRLVDIPGYEVRP